MQNLESILRHKVKFKWKCITLNYSTLLWAWNVFITCVVWMTSWMDYFKYSNTKDWWNLLIQVYNNQKSCKVKYNFSLVMDGSLLKCVILII